MLGKRLIIVLVLILFSLSCIKLNKKKLEEKIGSDMYAKLGFGVLKTEPKDTTNVPPKTEPTKPDSTTKTDKLILTKNELEILVKKASKTLQKRGILEPISVGSWSLVSRQSDRISLIINLSYKDKTGKHVSNDPVRFIFNDPDKPVRDWKLYTAY